jgi:hypothetical protein
MESSISNYLNINLQPRKIPELNKPQRENNHSFSDRKVTDYTQNHATTSDYGTQQWLWK